MRYYQRISCSIPVAGGGLILYVRARLLHWSCIIISQVASFPTLQGITGCSPDLAVLGGKRAASLQEAATSPHPLSIQQNAIKVVSRLEPVPILHGCTASHAVFAYMLVAMRRFCERTTGPRFSILADQSTLANAAVLEPCTTNKHVLNHSGKYQTSSIESGHHVADVRPGFIAPRSGLVAAFLSSSPSTPIEGDADTEPNMDGWPCDHEERSGSYLRRLPDMEIR